MDSLVGGLHSARGRVTSVLASLAVVLSGAALVVVPGVPAGAAPTAGGSISGAGVGAGTKSGVFRDINANGTWDSGEPGQGGISVTATCVVDDGGSASSVDDVLATFGPVTTAADGSYSISGTKGVCRVEFAIPANLQSIFDSPDSSVVLGAAG